MACEEQYFCGNTPLGQIRNRNEHRLIDLAVEEAIEIVRQKPNHS